MKNLLFICGPNGVGKSTVCRALVERLPGSAYVDSDPCRVMNPFVLDDVTIPVIEANISGMLRNYFACEYVDTVIFSYGFHGRRRDVFERVMASLEDLDYRFIPLLLTCGEEENLHRMQADGRDESRIRRALEASRAAFDGVEYPRIDVTDLTVKETAEEILKYL